MSIPELTTIIADAYGVKEGDVKGRNRRQPVAIARQVIYYYAYLLGDTYESIAEKFGRTHGAIFHGVEKITGWRYDDWQTKEILDGIEAAHPLLKGGQHER
jgi:chromosomal replication initiation ATPase DnaA